MDLRGTWEVKWTGFGDFECGKSEKKKYQG